MNFPTPPKNQDCGSQPSRTLCLLWQTEKVTGPRALKRRLLSHFAGARGVSDRSLPLPPPSESPHDAPQTTITNFQLLRAFRYPGLSCCYCFSLIIVRPQGAWVSETGYSEPPAKVSLPAGGTWKPLEASRGCSWSRIFAEFANQPLPHASGVALGSLGVDFGELSAPKNDDF